MTKRTMRIAVLTMGLALAAGIAWTQSTAPARRLAPADAPGGTRTALVDLGAEFPQLKGFTFGQMLVTVPPGTGRAWHSHVGSPEIVRILSGTLTDQRGDGPPTTYGPGSTLVNAGGISHMWANLGTEPVVFIATMVRPAAPQPH